jgi:L-fucono-1,5-lactonase
MILDTHQHFWKANRGDGMTPAVPILARDFRPSDLRPELRKAGVTRTVLVQAAQTTDETDFLLKLAEETDFVAGVIGWFDLEDKTFPWLTRKSGKGTQNSWACVQCYRT